MTTVNGEKEKNGTSNQKKRKKIGEKNGRKETKFSEDVISRYSDYCTYEHTLRPH